MLIRLASLHLFARKCSLMRGDNKLTRQEKVVQKFKDKAKIIHNDKYDYSNVVFCSQKTEVQIGCPIHGPFYQRKDVHLKGGGCKKCLYENMPLKRTIEEFVSEAAELHSNKYDYSMVHTTKSTEKISIICHIHGVFEQTVAHHLVSRGCPECSLNLQRLTHEQFISKSTETHSGKYDYSRVNLTKGSKEKVEIICPEHGVFTQPAGPHMHGNGCKKCADLKNALSYRLTLDEFISRSVEKHGDKYDYSMVNYTTCEDKVKIFCKTHGEFSQRPTCHMGGKGCVKCRNDNTTYNFIQKYRDNRELGNTAGLIYLLKITGNNESFLKLGITSNKSGRFKHYRKQFKAIGYSYEILFESAMPNYQTAMLENEIFKQMRREGNIYKPVFDFSGKSECITVECFEQVKSLILNHTKDKYFD